MFPPATRTGRALSALRGAANRLTGPGGLLDDVLGDPVPATRPHPHRRPLRSTRPGRPGTVPGRPQVCVCPVRNAPGPAAPATGRPVARHSTPARLG